MRKQKIPKGMKYMKRWIELGFIPELTYLKPYWEAIRLTNQQKHALSIHYKLLRS